jgi:hypothetical protein
MLVTRMTIKVPQGKRLQTRSPKLSMQNNISNSQGIAFSDALTEGVDLSML